MGRARSAARGDPLQIEGISGTSAGAMNAAVMAAGYAQSGAEGARAALATYWRRVSDAARFSPFQRSPIDRMLGRWTMDNSPLFFMLDTMSRLYSPYDLNPSGSNALLPILEKEIDFDRLRNSPIKVFITATNVRTGRGRGLPQCRYYARRAARLGLPADACSRRWRSTASPIGTAAIRAIPTMTPLVSECVSDDTILVHDQSGRAARHAEIRATKFSIASTRSRSTPC